MDLNLKTIKGFTTDERMVSIDGALKSINRRLGAKSPDERLKIEVEAIRQTLTILLDFLGLKEELGPESVIKQTRIVKEIEHALGPDNTL
jgi:hypothetical protein